MATFIRLKRTGLLLLLIPLVSSITTHAQEPAYCNFNYGTYSEHIPMSVKSAAMASGVIDGKIYLAAGFDIDQNEETIPLDHLSVFDPEADTWDTTGARIPVSRQMYGQMNTVQDGKLYLIGGLEWEWVSGELQAITHARVDVYDPQSDAWELKANLPIPLGGNGVCTDSVKLYVTGGITTENTQSSSFYSYDPVTDSWEELTEMPNARTFHVSVALGGKIYVISGNSGGGPENRTKNCIVYDPDSAQWYTIAPLPNAVVFAAGCVVDGEIYVFGGLGDNGISGDAYKYIPEEDTWIIIEEMVPPRRDIAAVPVGRTIYLIGGRTTGTEVSDLVQTFEPNDLYLDSIIPDDTIKGDTVEVNLSNHFGHMEGGEIIYSVFPDDPGIVDATVDGGILTVTGLAVGDAEVSILAESGEDQICDVFLINVEIPTGIDDKCNIHSSLNIYPNPSRGMATIEYSVQTTGTVRLEVYDLLGRRVAIPLNEYRVPGEYEYHLNTGVLDPGIYFCDLATASERVTAKLIVEH